MRISYLVLPAVAVTSLGLFVTQIAHHASAAPSQPVRAVRSIAAPAAIRAEGRMVTYPGAQVTVGSEITGRVTRVAVLERAAVRRGDVLVEIDDGETRAALAEARARIAEATAEVTAADTDVVRAQQLAGTRAISRQELDHTTRDRDAAVARRDAAIATANRLEATLAKCRIVAPIGGVVTGRLVQPGEIVAPGTALVTLADLRRTRIEAEVDEYDVGRIALGTAVAVSAEGFGGQTWAGRVEEIPDEVVGRRLKPEDPGKPSDTRVLLVKIALQEPTPLKLGQRVEVAIGTVAKPAG
jgi:HlyD family secretion protein